MLLYSGCLSMTGSASGDIYTAISSMLVVCTVKPLHVRMTYGIHTVLCDTWLGRDSPQCLADELGHSCYSGRPTNAISTVWAGYYLSTVCTYLLTENARHDKYILVMSHLCIYASTNNHGKTLVCGNQLNTHREKQ